MAVHAIYVEKKPAFADEAAAVAADLRLSLQIQGINSLRIINRYFAQNISLQDFAAARDTIFSEPPLDITYDTMPAFDNARVFAVEYLPGQFDQRADSCAQCISLATGKERPLIQAARIYAIQGDISEQDWQRIKAHLINPVESREAHLYSQGDVPATLSDEFTLPADVAVVDGFITLSESELEELRKRFGFAMDLSDIQFCQDYFKDKEKRDPTFTELRVLDTYWSDHCRHTTFLTELEEIIITTEDTELHGVLEPNSIIPLRDTPRTPRLKKVIKESYKRYLELRKLLGREDKPITLMDMATIGARALKQKGLLPDLDESKEINACSVKIKVDVDGVDKDWLLMFKNETHNHPTEIEPFGGAATCLGGAIRDPLSGRAFVYQAMRLSGAADPLQTAAFALPGKLPQRKICRTAAAGYSSYGNQIGLATGLVHEIYHPGYAAKRMEVGAVIGAAPAENVVRNEPDPGDVVILLGGRTGRDGCGGATGSSKSHSASSLESCGAEVQKGNAPEERKIQRLFRDPQATRLIKRCNDFGAGGVSVSIGELADGLEIDLNKVPKKYEGLDGTELAISESQERMSIVIAPQDAQRFIELAAQENLEATIVAHVTKEPRLVMKWNKKTIVNLSREFLNSNGAKKSQRITLINANKENIRRAAVPLCEDIQKFVSKLNICSQKGLGDRFDSSVGAATVISPYGGIHQLTPAQVMAAKLPVLQGETNTCSLMSYGFDPEISTESPYHGAVFAVVHSVAKIIAAGGSRRKCWLSFQEYFERLRDDPLRWGKPVAALLGALDAQLGLETAAIGGKDSMSGSFTLPDDTCIDVPPTLISFAVSVAHIDNIITPEFKKAGSYVYLFKLRDFTQRHSGTEEFFNELRALFDGIEKLILDKKIISCWALGQGGTAEAIPKMCFGNRLGFAAEVELACGDGFGGFVIETEEDLSQTVTRNTASLNFDHTAAQRHSVSEDKRSNHSFYNVDLLGRTTESYILKTPSIEMFMFKVQHAWEKTLEPVYPVIGTGDRGLGTGEQGVGSREKGKEKKEERRKEEKLEGCEPPPNNARFSLFTFHSSFFFSTPLFLIPVFPGTNSEYDTARAIEKAGGKARQIVIRNLSPADIQESVREMEKAIRSVQGIVIPGGFSGGDEPDGSGKFITAFFRNPAITDAVMELLQKRDGLICGICNGFQALIKLGLVPYGEIREQTESAPTLTFNKIGRHQATLVRSKVVSINSPWLSKLELGRSYLVPVSHGEGRFTADSSLIQELAANGQIATQYVDLQGNPSMDIRYNPNGSDFAIEGITSPCGRVFGRMGHNERYEPGLFKNVGKEEPAMNIFEGAVAYFC